MKDTARTMIMNDELADVIAKRLGDLLREARLNKKLSQHRLSDQVEINTSYYSLIENGEVNLTVRKLMCICAGLGIRPDVIMRGLVDSLENSEIPKQIH
ncbi:MAG: helix-turn-helix transcriptional regulator [Oscillospiraceae bacterium]|nr:helix-turn-helix transcriptional regulator [Oscillospiraceae bacterium]